jgi:hypothetical protein
MKPKPFAVTHTAAALCGLALTLTLAGAVPATAAAAAPAPVAALAAPLATAPAIDARNWVLVDFASGQALAEHGADQHIEPASLTKLMTAYAVFNALRDGRLKMDEQVLISEHAWRAEGSRTFVQVGTRVPVDVLIKGMIVQSGNDATIALAERVGGSEPAFVQMMNAYAQRLGMGGTHFEDASGLPSPTHYSTARDLATLSRAIIREFPEYYGIYSMREFTWNNIRQENRNGLLERDPTVDGIKTGHTESAGYCLIAARRHAPGVRGARFAQRHGARDRQRRAAELRLQFLSVGDGEEARRDGAEAARLQGQRTVRRRRGAGSSAGDRAARTGRQRDDARQRAAATAGAAGHQRRGRRAAGGGRRQDRAQGAALSGNRGRRRRPVAAHARLRQPVVLAKPCPGCAQRVA